MCRGALVITENNGVAESIDMQRCMTIYRPGRILTVTVKFLQSLVKRGRLVVTVKTQSGGSSVKQTIELQSDHAIRIDLWNTLMWRSGNDSAQSVNKPN